MSEALLHRSGMKTWGGGGGGSAVGIVKGLLFYRASIA